MSSNVSFSQKANVSISQEDRKFGNQFSFSYASAIVVKKNSDMPKDVKGSLNGMAVMNVMGYIPLISIISGIARIIFALTNKLFDLKQIQEQNKGEMKALQQAQILRGLLECTSVAGLALLVTDIVMTAKFVKEMKQDS